MLAKEDGATWFELRRRKRNIPRSATRARPMTPPTTPPTMAPTFADVDFWVPPPPVLPPEFAVVIAPELVVMLGYWVEVEPVIGVDSGLSGARIGLEVLSVSMRIIAFTEGGLCGCSIPKITRLGRLC